MKGIFYNSYSAVCSIHETGKMVYECLKKSSKYELDYSQDRQIKNEYDFLVYNQHETVNDWITEAIAKKFTGPKFCIVTEVPHSGHTLKGVPKYFDYYIVLDPTIEETDNIFGFIRPIESFEGMDHKENEIPLIGSFGFATPGKEWHKIVEAVQNEFDEAKIRFNIPPATYVWSHGEAILSIHAECKNIIKKEGIQFEITTNYLSQQELIKWCSENTINCFFYNRNQSHPTGLCAVVDQAISSRRPILVTNDTTFRHVLKYLTPYPNIGIKEAIKLGYKVEEMYKDWSCENFYGKFENILFKNA